MIARRGHDGSGSIRNTGSALEDIQILQVDGVANRCARSSNIRDRLLARCAGNRTGQLGRVDSWHGRLLEREVSLADPRKKKEKNPEKRTRRDAVRLMNHT